MSNTWPNVPGKTGSVSNKVHVFVCDLYFIFFVPENEKLLGEASKTEIEIKTESYVLRMSPEMSSSVCCECAFPIIL